MVRQTVFMTSFLVLMAAAAHAESPAPAGILSYISDDAVVAARIRAPQLAATALWKKTTAADASPYRQFMKFNPLTIDPEKDVADVVFALAFDYVGGEPKNPHGGLALRLLRDVDAKTLFKSSPWQATVKGVTGPAWSLPWNLFVVCPDPRTVLVGSPEYLAKVAGAAPGPRDAAAAAFWAGALDRPGEMVGAARMTDGMRRSLHQMIEKGRDTLRKGSWSREAADEFIGTDLCLRLMLELESGTLVMDLSRSAEALELKLALASDNATAFVGSGLALLEPSLTASLRPGSPAEPGPPQEPMYRTAYQGREVRAVMSRAMLLWLAMEDQPAAAKAEMRAKGESSLRNLLEIAKAWRAYAAATNGASATGLVELQPYLGENPRRLRNPVLRDHVPAGDYALVRLPRFDELPNPGFTVLAFERYADPDLVPADGIGVVFADGQYARLQVEEFNRLLAETRQLIEMLRKN